MKNRVTGIDGIFFKSKDRKGLMEWYQKHLGIAMEEWGAVFQWDTPENPAGNKYTAFSIFDDKGDYMKPSKADFMINFQVENLDELLTTLEKEGVEVMSERENSDFGNFGWIIDPEGRKIELWEPPKK
ncbi:VOC family protein [Jiulongibacter sediminis]|uniref:VOC family protein n=1 Tax=Jiulongibacter sediminis TaxID=1605367 RepID=UPI0026EBB993|nr:VOC family protein [Jiulongibacter sediminis]